MELLWKASKLYGVPLTHPYLQDLNVYDLQLMKYLTFFENPKNKEQYEKTYIDEDFDDYWKGDIDNSEFNNDIIHDEKEWEVIV